METVRHSVFVLGKTESIQTVVQVERGFRLSMQAVPASGVQRLMQLLQELYPHYSSRILVVNLPGYLAWFVRFVKTFLHEITAAKIMIVDRPEDLLQHFDPDGLPSYYKTNKTYGLPEKALQKHAEQSARAARDGAQE